MSENCCNTVCSYICVAGYITIFVLLIVYGDISGNEMKQSMTGIGGTLALIFICWCCAHIDEKIKNSKNSHIEKIYDNNGADDVVEINIDNETIKYTELNANIDSNNKAIDSKSLA